MGSQVYKEQKPPDQETENEKKPETSEDTQKEQSEQKDTQQNNNTPQEQQLSSTKNLSPEKQQSTEERKRSNSLNAKLGIPGSYTSTNDVSDSDSSNSIPKEVENFSQPSKSILLQDEEDNNNNNNNNEEPETDHPKPKYDIDTEFKSVFAGIKPLHNDTTQEEIDKYSKGSNYRNEYDLIYYRKGEEIRRTYIEKLITKKVWIPSQKEKTHNSLIIFDWDDTLLCTSFLTPGGVFNEDMVLKDEDKEKIKVLEYSVLRVLTLAVDKGDVFIITNSGQGWVEFSAEKFYPSIKDILGKIKIISARAEYEYKFPGDSRKWKIQTFLNLQKNLNNDLVTNIICLGDSSFELEAGHILASKFTQAFIKTVKFRENPKPEELNKQLCLVADQFHAIYSSVKNLTIRVEKKKNR